MLKVNRKTALIAIILGAVYPYVLSLLYSLLTPGRDELPSPGNPLGVMACCGLGIFSFPLVATVAGLNALYSTIYSHGYTIPWFDALASNIQMYLLLAIGYAVNVLFWYVSVTVIRRVKLSWVHEAEF